MTASLFPADRNIWTSPLLPSPRQSPFLMGKKSVSSRPRHVLGYHPVTEMPEGRFQPRNRSLAAAHSLTSTKVTRKNSPRPHPAPTQRVRAHERPGVCIQRLRGRREAS